MAISSADLYQFAKQMAVDSSGETQLRAAISRAYYAAFHAAEPFAEMLPRSAVCPASVYRVTHAELIERLREWKVDGINSDLSQFAASKSQLWRTVEAARDLRIKADYRLSSAITLAEAQTAIARVGLVLRHMELIDEVMKADPNTAEKTGDDAA